MNLFIVRHTRPDVPPGTCYGSTDVALPAGWQRHADDVAQRLRHIGALDAARVFSSPLQRCGLLAAYLFPHASVVFDTRLQELDFGEWEGCPWSDVPRALLDKWAADVRGFRPPGGENYRQLKNRCAAFLQERLPTGNSDCCIVTHGGVIRALLALLLPVSDTADETTQLAGLMETPIACGTTYHLKRRNTLRPFVFERIHVPQ